MNVQGRKPSSGQLATATTLGILAGLLLGYVFIGSVDRILQLQTGKPQLPVQHSVILESGGNVEEGIEQDRGLGRKEVASSGGHVRQKKQRGFPTKGDTIHTLFTSNGTPYINFQTRIMYGTYQMIQRMPGGEKLVGFTRILHRTQPDVLMNEVPTFRADPLTPKCDGWCEFPVSDRPNAVAQFFKAAEAEPTMIKAPWLLMLEGDYVWMKPLQAPRAESSDPSWAFPYSYINPTYPSIEPIIRQMYPSNRGPLSDVPGSGPAPVLMRVHEWIKVMPDWERLTAFIEASEERKEKLGWVREMYAFSAAAALQNVKLELIPPPDSPLMAQPPADHSQGNAALLHYTWGTLVEEMDGTQVWEFDKRRFTAPEIERKSPNIPLPPPLRPGLKLHDGTLFDATLHNFTVAMLTQMNAAIDRLPVLT